MLGDTFWTTLLRCLAAAGDLTGHVGRHFLDDAPEVPCRRRRWKRRDVREPRTGGRERHSRRNGRAVGREEPGHHLGGGWAVEGRHDGVVGAVGIWRKGLVEGLDGAECLFAVPGTGPQTERLREDGVGRIVDDGAAAFANKPGEELGIVGGKRRGIRDDDEPRGGLHGGGNGGMEVEIKPAAGERGGYAARKRFHP